MTAFLNTFGTRLGKYLVLPLILAAAALILTSLPACNTTEGVGKDVQAVGEAVEDAADDAKD